MRQKPRDATIALSGTVNHLSEQPSVSDLPSIDPFPRPVAAFRQKDLPLQSPNLFTQL